MEAFVMSRKNSHFGKRHQAQSSLPERASHETPRHLEPTLELAEAVPMRSAKNAIVRYCGAAALTICIAIAATKALPTLIGSAVDLETPVTVAITKHSKANGDEAEELAELLRMQLAERERMDREEEERQRQWREEGERLQKILDERRRREAEDERHAEQIEQMKREAALKEQLHREQLEQAERLAKAQERAEKQQRIDAERRHREQIAQMKKTEKAVRDQKQRSVPYYGPAPGVVPNRTERMMGGSPGLFDRD